VADWNKKNPDCMVSGEVTVKQVESTDWQFGRGVLT
jgi:hypothetical protein